VHPFIDINESAFRSKIEKLTLKKFKRGSRAGMHRVIMAWKAKAVIRVPKKSKNLMHSIRARTQGSGFDVVGRLRATADYAQLVHNGTGLYGPRHDYIRRGYGFSRGQKPQPFFEESWNDIKKQAQRLFKEGFFSALR